MKRPFLFAALAAILFLASCSPSVVVIATPTPVDVSAISTSAVETAYAALTLSAPTATAVPTLTPTLAATDTPVPTATPDYSAIKFVSLYLIGTNQTVFVFHLSGIRGEFHGMGNNLHQFECKTTIDELDKLSCYGPYVGPGQEIVFKLFAAGQTDPVLILDTMVPLPATPVGMRCEIEPLGGLGLPEYCYAVTCYIGVDYYGGTPNTCDQPWLWPVP